MNKIKAGVIGLGARGKMMIRDVIIPMSKEENAKIEVSAVCDLYEDRITDAVELVEKETGKKPACTADYNELINMSEVNAVLIFADWEMHTKMAVAAMKAGKYVGLEVAGAYDITDCWRLVDAYEETGTPLMFLENCCYGKRELMITKMVRAGFFGEVVHCDGMYAHDLRPEVTKGKENRHYRLRNYINRNCENYPTHELGPIAKLLNINNGNRLMTLTSTASSARGAHQYVLDTKGADHPLAGAEFSQGDVVTTVIKCAKGQTITMQLDTTLPRSYSRGFNVRGTKCAYFEDVDTIFENAKHAHTKYEWGIRSLEGNAAEYEEEFNHEVWKNFEIKGGHGGMDWLVMEAFVKSITEGHRFPLDVYDAATYMSITPLSEQSIATGSAPVVIPDFTRGKWMRRDDIEEWDYSLDVKEIYKDLY